MLNEEILKTINEEGKIRRNTIKDLIAFQAELREAGYNSYMDVTTNWLFVEPMVQVDKTMNIYWEHEGKKKAGVAHWFEDHLENYICFISDEDRQVLERIDIEDCAIGVFLEDIWEEITKREGNVTDFKLK
ncbi:MAG: hypothetical protein ACOX2Q_12020 [Dehalobacterium sp.]